MSLPTLFIPATMLAQALDKNGQPKLTKDGLPVWKLPNSVRLVVGEADGRNDDAGPARLYSQDSYSQAFVNGRSVSTKETVLVAYTIAATAPTRPPVLHQNPAPVQAAPSAPSAPMVNVGDAMRAAKTPKGRARKLSIADAPKTPVAAPAPAAPSVEDRLTRMEGNFAQLMTFLEAKLA